jgi:hypothetical protein
MNSFSKKCRRRRTGTWFLALLLLLAGGNQVRSQDASPSEYQVKAAFLYNFGKFVNWPGNAFTRADAPLVIGVFGSNPFNGDLERIVAHKKIDGHPVIVRLVKNAAEAKNCHILFVRATELAGAGKLTEALHGVPVLIVTENVNAFMASGYDINFVMEENKIRFEINNQAATQTGLTISSKLLSLAKPAEKLKP